MPSYDCQIQNTYALIRLIFKCCCEQNMDPLLAPEQIYELDTFTLEQKIEELQNHPSKDLYLEILKMAKLQLIDRLSTEEFGRLLANGQFKLDIDFSLPPILPSKAKQPPKASLNRKQISAQMQTQLVPGKSFLTIGKPAVSHHYKPKPKPRSKEAQPTKKPKQFLKAKKWSVSKPKIRASIQQSEQIMRNSEANGPRLYEKIMVVSDMPFQTREEAQRLPEPLVKEEFSLKDKLKREVEQMKVQYRENDAYDDMKVVKMIPLNLKEEQDKYLEMQQEAQPESMANEIPSVTEQVKNQPSSLQVQEKEEYAEICSNYLRGNEYCMDSPISLEQVPHPQKKEQSFESFQDHQPQLYQNAEKDSVLQFQKSPVPSKEQKFQALTPRISEKYLTIQKESLRSSLYQQTMTEDTAKRQEDAKQIQGLSKELKSRSLKNFTKKVIPSFRKDPQSNRYTSNIRQTFAHPVESEQELRTSLYQAKFGKAPMPKIKYSKVEQASKPIQAACNTFPYHQVIPSFSKLFPHSKNLLVTLRVVQENLCQHFSKNVNQKSISEESRRLSTENDLTFKIVYESEKARKYSQLFRINLDSFYRRSGLMLDRIRGQFDEPEHHQMLFYRVVRTKEEVYDIVNSSFHRTKNWYELPHGLELKNSWNLLWTWSRPQIDFSDLFYFQKVNHFLGNKQLARKDLLKKNIEKIQKLGSKIRQYFDIIPETFLLPGQNIPFIKKFRQNGLKTTKNYWILKPVGLSRGRGIQLVSKLEDVVFSEPVVLQKYITNPLLIDGYKFDMRIYVLVTGINPLEAFIYRQGFARLSTQPYSLSEGDIDNKFIHLTNFSIQRENLAADRKSSLGEDVGGSKISLRMLASKLSQMGVQWQAVEKSIEDIVLKSLIACMNAIPPNPNCFELFGYDIFIDQDRKCWLLEVNSSPSLEKEFTLDQVIKQQLVDDIVQIVNPLNYDRKRLLEVVERRRKEAEGLKSSINTGNNSTSQLNEDLDYILRGQKLRRYGQAVESPNFKMIAPSDNYNRIVKALQQYKIDPIVKVT